MDQDAGRNDNGSLGEAEKRRIESEIARNEAEREKLTVEAEEGRKRLLQKWYSSPRAVQLIVGVIVTAAVVLGWVVAYVYPIVATKTELQKVKNELLAAENRKRESENEREREELLYHNQNLEAQLAEALSQKKNAEELASELSKGYAELSKKKELPPDERERYKELAEKTDQEKEALKRDISQIKSAEIAAQLRSERLSGQSETGSIQSSTVVIGYWSFDRATVQKVKEDIESQGAKVYPRLLVVGPHKFEACGRHGCVFYRDDMYRHAAVKLVKVLKVTKALSLEPAPTPDLELTPSQERVCKEADILVFLSKE